MRIQLVVLACLMGSGCATILSGTRQDVSFSSRPASSTVVLGGVAGEVLAKVSDLNAAKDFLVSVLSVVLPDDARAFLLALSPDELLTLIVAAANPDARTTATVEVAGDLLARAPGPLRDAIAKLLLVHAAGSTPLLVNLKKGAEYAAISWSPGRRAHLGIIETRFNFVSLLNVFTLGIGFIVDALTGAWLSLSPTELSWELQPYSGP